MPKGLNAFYWYQIFALDSVVVEVQEMFSSQTCLVMELNKQTRKPLPPQNQSNQNPLNKFRKISQKRE